MYVLLAFLMLLPKSFASAERCEVSCPSGDAQMDCGFDANSITYKMFPSKCAMNAYSKCYDSDYASVPLKYCIKAHITESRRSYGESCPVFCPNHYRPVCGASKFRDYIYKTFNNGCYLDMINCRGDEDLSGYIEVPLEYCQKHMMKNIFREQVVISNLHDYRDYE
ncbi:uncharacterized protein LOC115442711 isoform X2 [Manduca sexta]|uniref:Enhancer of split M1 protein n=1 Tax=Manduca sexta TaxID=7130 RepID=A0A922CK72_MANSE|nr:uncharacterized protein LOC115442711 isoform X2 [Manduca sexta]KAG6448894.1 hypothetical protein O3G_MSEX005749 [Manduca sexta]